MKLSDTFYDLHQKLTVNNIAEIDWFKHTSENVCNPMCQFVRSGVIVCTITVRLVHRKISYELMHRLVSSLRVIRQQKKSVLTALRVFMDINIECVGFIADSRFRAQTSKKVRDWKNLALRLKLMCNIMFILVRVSSISFCRQTSSQGCSSPFSIHDEKQRNFSYTFS